MQKKILFAFIFLVSFVFYSCDEQDADNYTHEHFEPTRWVFELNGEAYLEINNGFITNNFNSEILLYSADTTNIFKIVFYDESGQKINLHEDNNISWKVDNGSIIKIEKLDDKDQKFSIKGLKVGDTKITFYINHGDHSDITSPPILISIK